MNTKYDIHPGSDSLEQMLKEVPLEKPGVDFTKNIMDKIRFNLFIEQTPFYKKPLFIGITTVCLSIIFLILYNADFSWFILVEQVIRLIENIKEYFSALLLSNRNIGIPSTIIAPILIITIIFLIDRIIVAREKGREHPVYTN